MDEKLKTLRAANLTTLINKVANGRNADFQRQYGVDSSLLSNIRCGRKGLGEDLARKIEALTGAPKGYLDTDQNEPGNIDQIRENRAEYINNGVVSLPLISSVTAGTWSESSDPYAPGAAEEWVKTLLKVSNNAFALRVKGNSMQNPYGTPSIPEGAIVIVEPAETTPQSGKIVVAKLADSQEVTLKRLVIDGGTTYLEPLNPKFDPIKIGEDCIIVGTVKQVIQNI